MPGMEVGEFMVGEPHRNLSFTEVGPFDGALRGMALLERRTSQSTPRSLVLRLSISLQAISSLTSTGLDRLCE